MTIITDRKALADTGLHTTIHSETDTSNERTYARRLASSTLRDMGRALIQGTDPHITMPRLDPAFAAITGRAMQLIADRITATNPHHRATVRNTVALADTAGTPTLVMDHHPGFTFEPQDEGTPDPFTIVFSSDCDAFPLSFQIAYFTRQRELSVSLLPGSYELEADSVEDMMGFGDNCDGLQQWFDDCATVLRWAQTSYPGTTRKEDGTMD